MYCDNGGFMKQKILPSTQKKYIQVARSTSALLKQTIQDCVENGPFKSELNVELTHYNISRALKGVIFFCLFTFEMHHLCVQNKCTADEFYQNFIKILLDGMKI